MNINNDKNLPLVSVCVQTYNHDKYIAECLDGILAQKTNFDFEIILGEDESSDNTREICIDYQTKNPDKIKLFLRNRKDVIYIDGSPTGRYNFIENLKQCSGKFIALCPGDDFWTDPNKLQRQVEFMENHPEFVATGHSIAKLENDKIIEYHSELYKDAARIELMQGFWIPTLSLVFRKPAQDILDELWRFARTAPNGDTVLISCLGQFGGYKFMKDIAPAVYRIHDGGVWSKVDKKLKVKKRISTYMALYNYFYQRKNEDVSSYWLRKAKNEANNLLELAITEEVSIFKMISYLRLYNSIPINNESGVGKLYTVRVFLAHLKKKL